MVKKEWPSLYSLIGDCPQHSNEVAVPLDNIFLLQRLRFIVIILSMKRLILLVLSLFILTANVCQGEDQMDKTIVVLETSQGNVEFELKPGIAPKTCENFIGLTEKGYYDGIVFHRIIENFMIQGGDPTGTGRGGSSLWGTPFEDEVSPGVTFDKPGILAMANSGPNTNGSQFFITVAPTPWLNGNHTIFGEVVAGIDVIEKLENVPTGTADKPLKEQKIIKAYLK